MAMATNGQDSKRYGSLDTLTIAILASSAIENGGG